MEQPNMLLNKRNAQLLGRRKHSAIILAPRGRRNIFRAAPRRPKHIVDEGKEGVGADGHARQLAQPLLALLGREDGRDVAVFEVGFEVIALDARVGDQAGT
jgi:hypothetical protein